MLREGWLYATALCFLNKSKLMLCATLPTQKPWQKLQRIFRQGNGDVGDQGLLFMLN